MQLGTYGYPWWQLEYQSACWLTGFLSLTSSCFTFPSPALPSLQLLLLHTLYPSLATLFLSGYSIPQLSLSLFSAILVLSQYALFSNTCFHLQYALLLPYPWSWSVFFSLLWTLPNTSRYYLLPTIKTFSLMEQSCRRLFPVPPCIHLSHVSM